VVAQTWCQKAVCGAASLTLSGPGAPGGRFTAVNRMVTPFALLMPANPACVTLVLAGYTAINSATAADGLGEFMCRWWNPGLAPPDDGACPFAPAPVNDPPTNSPRTSDEANHRVLMISNDIAGRFGSAAR